MSRRVSLIVNGILCVKYLKVDWGKSPSYIIKATVIIVIKKEGYLSGSVG